jgi:RHH-type transcriptional regulator, rel operon repressor / antitoxin RelB
LLLYCERKEMILALDLPREIEERLETIASRTGRSKETWAAEAIVEALEDQEDYLVAVERLRLERPGIPLEEAERQLGLAG